MFRKHPESVDSILQQFIRDSGLETPLLHKRIIDAWDEIMPPSIVSNTGQKFIKNQTLMIKILSPAMRQDLSLMRSQLVQKLNTHVGSQVIYQLTFY